MILESSSGKNQHYACPKGQTVDVPPHGKKTIPMDGVCVARNKPPVGKGVPGDLVVNEGNPTIPKDPNSHVPAKDANKLLRICTSKYDAADKLLKDGALKDIPYADPKKKKDIVVQWSTWTDPQISELTGAPAATKDDLKKIVYKQLETQGPLTPEKKKKVDDGINTIFDKVELTTAKAKDLEKPEPYQQTEIPARTFDVSDQNEVTPMPWSGPLPQTKEKPKKAKQWPKPIQDWIDKKKAADDADAKKKGETDDYNQELNKYFDKSKHHTELKDQRDKAKEKADAPGAGQADKDNYKNAQKELDKLETELKKDFNKTPEGQKAFGKGAEAEKAASEAHAAEGKAGQNIDPDVKKEVQKAEDEAKKAIPAQW